MNVQPVRWSWLYVIPLALATVLVLSSLLSLYITFAPDPMELPLRFMIGGLGFASLGIGVVWISPYCRGISRPWQIGIGMFINLSLMVMFVSLLPLIDRRWPGEYPRLHHVLTLLHLT